MQDTPGSLAAGGVFIYVTEDYLNSRDRLLFLYLYQ
ncbi:hypothetical protein SAMN05216378_4272 [Paenibacillus catalpae]|uniref:Uncharacterized protein n=1 Tax=Paenibacillus catalpae TaxID=1045775 RepID=A0A1I2DTQ6_9BACL|nr:hypothetical protein SAMN05216378_4272 [Paenibacillus catalpae]